MESHQLKQSPLGKPFTYNGPRNPNLLFAIDRSLRRQEIGLVLDDNWWGMDIWNAYEISWILPSGKTAVAIGVISYSAHSEKLVESKSLKLYLNSIGNSVFARRTDVENAISHDLSQAIKCDVIVSLYDINDRTFTISPAPGICIDNLDIVAIPDFNHRLDALKAIRKNKSDDADAGLITIYSDLFRSNCPVTGQPDWATIIVEYSANETIDNAGFLSYLLSFRAAEKLHEECVEVIFSDLMSVYTPEKLTVTARYTRRGGIDINPIRSNFTHTNWQNLRLPRQ